jgi:hypothetical protein
LAGRRASSQRGAAQSEAPGRTSTAMGVGKLAAGRSTIEQARPGKQERALAATRLKRELVAQAMTDTGREPRG